MEYDITFVSRETFLKKLKNVEDIENNSLYIWNNHNELIYINFIIDELLKFKKISLGLQFFDTNTKIPENIYNLHIPISICKLQNLKSIIINDVFFKKIPLALCDLQNIECIYTNIQPHKNFIFYKKKRLIFRLYFILNKSYIFNKILKYKIFERLLKY
jgi:hypothetical protein